MRWRPPTRPLILIALLLLAGATVNVAVAWVLVGAPESWTSGGPRITIDPDGRAPAWILPSGDHEPIAIATQRGFGWRFVLCEALDHQELKVRSLEGVAAGWPALSLFLRESTMGWSSRSRSWGILPPRQLLPSRDWFPAQRNRLPVLPIPIGFAINTLFYAAILALPLSFLPIRRRLRARRGRCPKCGYDLAGLGGLGALLGPTAAAERRPTQGAAVPCPECGAASRGL